MNICVISPFYPTKDGLGGYFFVEQLVLAMAAQGHNIYVIAPVNIASELFIRKPYGCYYEHRQTDNNGSIDVYRPRIYGRNITIRGVNMLEYCRRVAIERVIIRHKLQIDVFYGHFFRSAVLAWRYASNHNIPLFVASGESTIPSLLKPCLSFSLEAFKKTLSGVVCVSTKNKDEAIALGYASPEQCAVFPNGVDLSLFKPLNRNECRQRLGLPLDKFIVVCAGNFTERKGQTRVVDAIEKLNNPSIGAVLAGRGNEVIDSAFVLYKGFVNHDYIPVYLCAADAFVIPTRWEGCCNSIIEAMACGLPIVSSNRSFNWDVLNKENSILIDPDNVEEIADAIDLLFNDSTLRERLGQKSLSVSKGLSIEERANKIIRFIYERNNVRCKEQ